MRSCVPFAPIPLGVAAFGPSIMPILDRTNDLVEKYSGFVLPVLLAGLGMFLAIDALLYLTTGVGLF